MEPPNVSLLDQDSGVLQPKDEEKPYFKLMDMFKGGDDFTRKLKLAIAFEVFSKNDHTDVTEP